jgi:adenine/guanine phosphoribosyltransferase-like PRPP-binding protein
MDDHKPSIVTNYLDHSLDIDNLKKLIAAIAKGLKPYDFQSIAFRGVSGALLAPALALKMNKTLIVVRKPKEEEMHHSYMDVEGDQAVKQYVIVDDLVVYGKTVRAIVKGIAEFAPEARCIGVVQARYVNERGFSLSDMTSWIDDTHVNFVMHPKTALKPKVK